MSHLLRTIRCRREKSDRYNPGRARLWRANAEMFFPSCTLRA